MSESESAPQRVNATLDQFTSPKQNAEPKPASEQREDQLFNLDNVDSPALEALVDELSTDELETVVDDLGGSHKHLLAFIEEATADDELASNIESVMQFRAERPSLVKAAGDYIEEALGMRPFDLTLTEPDNDFQDPMVCLDVDDDVVLTNNPDINTELLNHATRIKGVTKSGQESLFERWADAIGADQVVEFKQGRHPDALGFAIPGQIPATGDEPGNTPITEIPYIGPATAEDIHPSGDLLAIDDLDSLTKKQRAWIDFGVDNKDYDSRLARGIVRGLITHAEEDAPDLIGAALNMKDRRESDGQFDWVNPANTFGISHGNDVLEEFDTDPTISTSQDGNKITSTSSAGESMYKQEYWQMLTSASEASSAEVQHGEYTPAFIELPGNRYLVAAQIAN